MLKGSLALLSLSLGFMVMGQTLDPGGKSLDFGDYRISVPESGATGKNLIRNGNFEAESKDEIKEDPAGRKRRYKIVKPWGHQNQIWSSDAAVRKKILPFMRAYLENVPEEKRGNILVLENQPAIADSLDEKGRPMHSTKIYQLIPVETGDKPEIYHFSMMAKGSWNDVPGAKDFILFCRFYDRPDGKGKNTGTRLLHRFLVSPSEWQRVACQVVVPPKTKSCVISIALYGVGKIFLDDITFCKVMGKEAAAKLYPMYRFDNTAWLGAGQVNALKFGLKNQRWEKPRNLCLHLILPDGLKAVGCSGSGRLVKTVKQKDSMTEYVFRINSASKTSYFHTSPNVLIEAAENLKGKDLHGICFLSNDGDIGCREQFKIKVVPSFRAQTPKRFKTSMLDLNHDLDFQEKDAKRFSVFYRNTGMSMVHGTADFNKLRDELHKQTGMPRAATRYWIGNGYRLGWRGYEKTPDQIAFKGIDGKPVSSYVCPAAVYQRNEIVMQRLNSLIEKYLQNHEFAMPNWEPFVANGLGCFCDRCCSEFIAYCRKNNPKITEQDIRAGWPKKILGQHKTDWIKFRSQQHGGVIRTLEELFVAAGRKMGKDAHFAPEFELYFVTEKGNPSAAQYDPFDFLSELSWVVLWGPYLYTHPNQVYQYYPGMNIVVLYACENVADIIAKRLPKGKIPNLIAMPGGGYDGGISEPEALAMDTLSAFAAGWKGSIPWTFPFGCDYRWWKALAKANDIIARNEDVVLDGVKMPDSTELIPLTKLPKTYIPTSWRECNANLRKDYPYAVGKCIVQHRTFRKDDVTVIAVGNFWSRGECFFELKVKDLKPGKYAVTDQDDLNYGIFSNTELKNGILLQAGALRWQFFRIEKNGSAGKFPISQKVIRRLMNKKQKRIAECADQDDAASKAMEEAALKFTRTNDLSNVKNITSGKVSLRRDDKYLRINTPVYNALLSPDDSGNIVECIAGKDNILVKRGSGHIGADAFWGGRYTLQMNGIYRLISCSAVRDGIEIKLEQNIYGNRAFSNVTLQKKYRFKENCFHIETAVINKSSEEHALHFRYHNMPYPLQLGSGIYQIGKQKFTRSFNVNLYRFGKPDEEVEVLVRSTGKIQDISPGILGLRRNEDSPGWKMVFPQEKAQSAVFWDSLKGSSAEVIFQKTAIKPGSSEIFSVKWEPLK